MFSLGLLLLLLLLVVFQTQIILILFSINLRLKKKINRLKKYKKNTKKLFNNLNSELTFLSNKLVN